MSDLVVVFLIIGVIINAVRSLRGALSPPPAAPTPLAGPQAQKSPSDAMEELRSAALRSAQPGRFVEYKTEPSAHRGRPADGLAPAPQSPFDRAASAIRIKQRAQRSFDEASPLGLTSTQQQFDRERQDSEQLSDDRRAEAVARAESGMDVGAGSDISPLGDERENRAEQVLSSITGSAFLQGNSIMRAIIVSQMLSEPLSRSRLRRKR